VPQFPYRQNQEPSPPAPYRTPRRIGGKDIPYRAPVAPGPIPQDQRETLEEHQAAQDAIELSAMRLQAQETLNAGMRAYAETNDPAVLDQAKKVAQSIPTQSKNPRIQTAYSASYQGMETEMDENVAAHVHAVKMKQTDALADQNRQRALETGNLQLAVTTNAALRRLHPENAVLYDQQDAEFDTASALAQAANLVRSENPVDVVRGTGILGGIKREGLRTELVAQLDTLLDQAKAQTTFFQGKNYDALAVEIDKVAADTSLTPAEVFTATAALRRGADAQIRSGEIDGTKGKVALNALRTLDNMAKATIKPQPDMKIQAEFYDRMDRAQSEQDFKDLREWMRGNIEAFGSTYDQRVKELYNRKGKGAYEAITASVNLTLGTDPLQERGPFLKYVHDMIAEKEKANGGKKLTDEEVHVLVPTVYVSWRANRAKKEAPVFSQKVLLPIYGKLRNKRYVDKDDKATATAAIEALIDRLGEDWQDHAPEAVKIIAENYSDAAEAFDKADIPYLEWNDLDAGIKKQDLAALKDAVVDKDSGLTAPTPSGNRWNKKDVEAAKRSAGDVAAFEEYLKGEPPWIAGWPSAESATATLPPVAERVVGKTYEIRGTRYEWQKDGWHKAP